MSHSHTLVCASKNQEKGKTMSSIENGSKHRLFNCLAASLILGWVCAGAVWAQNVTCAPQTYKLLADIGDSTAPISEVRQDEFVKYGWSTLLALAAPAVGATVNFDGDNRAQWEGWSSTADLLNQGASPGPSGSRYYPEECLQVPGYESYRVLDQVGKVDDSFLEADATGLSNSPVIAAVNIPSDENMAGIANALRYEIVLSPATYNYIVENGFNQAENLPSGSPVIPTSNKVIFPCGQASYTGGDPADKDLGALVIKLAWMDVEGLDAETQALFHREELLVHTPWYRLANRITDDESSDTCELRTMGLVGMHILHKTMKQPNWIWSTVEHSRNAPDCTAGTTPGPEFSGTVNTSCPTSSSTSYNFFPQIDDSDSQYQDCNTTPEQNLPDGRCDENDAATFGNWCLDESPNPDKGKSRLCRQLPLAENYPAADAANTACKNVFAGLGNGQSVWANYEVIANQWMDKDWANWENSCRNVAGRVFDYPNGIIFSEAKSLIQPTVDVTATDGSIQQIPFLANTSMESYERSNCLACHSKAAYTNAGGKKIRASRNTDFVWFLALEVPEAPDN